MSLKSKCCGENVKYPIMVDGCTMYICTKCERSTLAIKSEQAENKPTATKISTTYKISHKGKEITVEKSEDGRLTLTPQGMFDNDGFVFMRSKPNMVKEIGEMIIRASEI